MHQDFEAPSKQTSRDIPLTKQEEFRASGIQSYVASVADACLHWKEGKRRETTYENKEE